MPCKRKAPRRYETGTGEGSHPEGVQDYYRRVYSRLETLVVKAANKQAYEEDLKFVIKFYGEDLCQEQHYG